GLCIPETAIAYAAPDGSTSSACDRSAPCTFERAIGVADSSRNAIKLLQGVYAAPTNGEWLFEAGHHLTVYGPATLEGPVRLLALAIVGTVSLRLRVLASTAWVACGAPSLLAPVPSIELDHVTIVTDAAHGSLPTATISRCKGTIRDSILRTSDPYAAALVLSGPGGSDGQLTRVE